MTQEETVIGIWKQQWTDREESEKPSSHLTNLRITIQPVTLLYPRQLYGRV